MCEYVHACMCVYVIYVCMWYVDVCIYVCVIIKIKSCLLPNLLLRSSICIFSI